MFFTQAYEELGLSTSFGNNVKIYWNMFSGLRVNDIKKIAA
jgi:hypothetical protein